MDGWRARLRQLLHRGSGGSMYTRKRTQHGTPQGRPACPYGIRGSSRPRLEAPVFVRFPCVHAAATTPVQQLGVVLLSTHPYQPFPISLWVGLHVGFFEACSAFTHVAACTRARSPSRDRYQRLQTFRHLHACSGCFRLEPMPGGTCTHWKAPPCTAPRDTQPPIPTFADGSYLRCDWPHLLVSASTLWRVNSTSVSRNQRAHGTALGVIRDASGIRPQWRRRICIYDNALFSGATPA